MRRGGGAVGSVTGRSSQLARVPRDEAGTGPAADLFGRVRGDRGGSGCGRADRAQRRRWWRREVWLHRRGLRERRKAGPEGREAEAAEADGAAGGEADGGGGHE